MEIFYSFFFLHVFDRIAECGAGHGARMLVEELAQGIFPYSLPHLPEHPADRFMNEIMVIVQQ